MTNQNVPAIGPRKVVVTVTRVISYLLYFYIIVVEIILFIGFFLLLSGPTRLRSSPSGHTATSTV